MSVTFFVAYCNLRDILVLTLYNEAGGGGVSKTEFESLTSDDKFIYLM